MHIIIFTDTYLPKHDGISISLDLLTKTMSRIGYTFTICAPDYENNSSEDECNEYIRIIRFNSAQLPSYPQVHVAFPSTEKLKRALQSKSSDRIIHVQTPGPLGQAGMLAATLYSIPCMGTFHTLLDEQSFYLHPTRLLGIHNFMDDLAAKFIPDMLHPFLKLQKQTEEVISKSVVSTLTRFFYEQCKLVVTPSDTLKEELLQAGMRVPLHTVSNGMDLCKWHRQPLQPPNINQQQGDELKILHVGRIAFEKNIDCVIRAFDEVQKSYSRSTLTVTGEGPAKKSLEKLVQTLGIQNKVRFTENINHDQLSEFYPKHHLFLTASTMETQGLVVLEAMASGVPCIGVNSHALPELIEHGITGAVVQPFDFKSMAEESLKIVSDPNRYRLCSLNSVQHAEKHDIRESAKKLDQLYRSLVTKT